jgi:outer membrane receptor for ferrienterochelin and colicin
MKYALRLLLSMSLLSTALFAQGVTTAAINGTVKDNTGQLLPGVIVMAVHVPTGTKYGVTTRDDGQYNLPNLRVGGPYTVSVSLLGFAKQERAGINLQLSQTLRQNFTLSTEDVQMQTVEVTAEKSPVLNAARTGAATAISRNAIEALPTITRKVQDFSRLTPQFSGNNSFGGMDNRYNNTTIDGSYFNNSFGLQGQPGDRTGVAPISIDAVEQVQVNIAPYDVRQGNFVGAGINTITKSGTNDISGSVYYLFRHQGLVGQEAGTVEYKPSTFKYNQIGLRLGGPIIEDKLFFFGSFESDKITQPGTSFRANKGGETVAGNTTRVLQTDLNTLSSFLKTKFGYETGPYQDYNNETPAIRLLTKLDYNLDDANKLTLRYIQLDSKTDVLVSNSSSLGIGGNRQSSLNGLAYQNSNYQIGENIRNVIGEWNSIISDNMSNNLIVGYSHHDESRDSRGSFFPFVDILGPSATNYITFGYEAFTPNNELRYSSIQAQDNFSYSLDDHYFTLGASVEKYQSENVFFPGAQSAYVYNSMADFYYDANRASTDTAATLRRFQVRYSNIPGMVKPVQDLKVLYTGVYVQDEYQLTKDIRLSAGLRLDIPFFENTGFHNAEVDTMKFRDENGSLVQYGTDKLPNSNILWSPRVGFNWDVTGERTTQVRGGTGIFTGKPAYVWISNQIGNNGILTGFDQIDNTKLRPFSSNPDKYKPTTVSGTPAASYELALTDPDFKFPQLWRSNIAIDQQLPQNFTATAEFLYAKDVNGVYYINANMPAADTVFAGVDNRPRWKPIGRTNSDRIYSKIPNAVVMKNEDVGYSWSAAFSLEKAYSDGWFAKAAYSYGESKNTVDPGSIASGSWYGNAQSGNPNNPGVGFASTSPGHRLFATLSYREEYFDIGATTISVFWEGRTIGNGSYVFSGDLNGDGGTANDLIYIPKDQSEMNFKAIAASGTTPAFTVQQQNDAWDSFIKQDAYLNANRGKYAERGAVFMPMVFRADLSITQEVFTEIFGKRNALQFRADILNFTNLLNKDWGLSQRFVTTQPLVVQTPTADGKALYQLARVGGKLIDHTYEKTAAISDVFQIQLGVRYTFN